MIKKKGRGRPKGAPNKPKMELITERQRLHKNADVYEILCQANIVAEENEDFAVNGLRTYNETNGAVQAVLTWLHSDSIKSTLPTGKTPYTPNDAPGPDLTETQLRFEYKKFKYFVTNNVPQIKRETMWIELLEGIPAHEAEMLDLVRKKVNPFKGLTKEVVQKAFPNANIN